MPLMPIQPNYHNRLLALTNPAFSPFSQVRKFITVPLGSAFIGDKTHHQIGLTRQEYFDCFWNIKNAKLNATGPNNAGGCIYPWWMIDPYALIIPDGDGNQYFKGNNFFYGNGSHNAGQWAWPLSSNNFPPIVPIDDIGQQWPQYFDDPSKYAQACGTGVIGGIEFSGLTGNPVGIGIDFTIVYFTKEDSKYYPRIYVSNADGSRTGALISTDVNELGDLGPGAQCGELTFTMPTRSLTANIYPQDGYFIFPGKADASFEVIDTWR